MAAIFYSYGDNEMFTNSVGSGAAPASIDIFDNLVSEDNMCIITQIGVTMSDTVQFFLTFDDVIEYYWFGMGVGNITCQGMLFLTCDGTGGTEMPGSDALLTAVGKARGQECFCTMGKFSFTGVLIDCNITIVSEPETMATFSVTFGMIDHSLQQPTPQAPSC